MDGQSAGRERAFWAIALLIVFVSALFPVFWIAVAVAQGPGHGRRRPAAALEVVVRELLGDLRPGHLHRRAAQLARHRADRHADRRRARGDGRLRDRAPGLPGQAPDPRGRARDRDVPADLDRRPAVRAVAHDGPLRHLGRADHPVHDVHAAAGDLHALGVLPRDPVGARAGGPGRRGDALPGVPQDHRAARRARRVHDGDPRVHLRLERLRLRDLADLDRRARRPSRPAISRRSRAPRSSASRPARSPRPRWS